MKHYEFLEPEEIEEHNLEDWHIELLKMNPSYVGWSPGDDYMTSRGKGWNSNFETSINSAYLQPDDLNLIVNFYFDIERESKRCEECQGHGQTGLTRILEEEFHGKWEDKLEQEEIDALWERGRLNNYQEKPSPEKVNEDYKTGCGHDAINRWVCVETRAKKLGHWEDDQCKTCNATGSVFTTEEPLVNLILWVLHPRKGASRGVTITEIQEEHVPSLIDYLKRCRDNNTALFSGLPEDV